MATVSQTHQAFEGCGQLLDGDNPPIEVNYSIAVSFWPIDTDTLGGPGEVQWTPDSAEGFVRLLDRSDWARVEVPGNYSLVLKDGTRCRTSLRYSGEPSSGTYLIECSPNNLV